MVILLVLALSHKPKFGQKFSDLIMVLDEKLKEHNVITMPALGNMNCCREFYSIFDTIFLSGPNWWTNQYRYNANMAEDVHHLLL